MCRLKVSRLTYNTGQGSSVKVILQDIDFELKKGDFWIIWGNSGAGKTTLLQLLAGLLRPSAGEVISLNKKVGSKANGSQPEIGLVFQYPEQQFFQSTVEDDISYALRQKRLDETEIFTRVDKALEDMGLKYQKIKQRSPFELSGGEQRRLAIACALVNNPGILLLDEPTAGLDIRAKRNVLDCIEKLNSEHKIAVLLADSGLDDLRWQKKKILVLSQGRQIYCGEMSQIHNQNKLLVREGLRLPALLELQYKLKESGLPLKHPLNGTGSALVRLKQLLSSNT